MVCLFAQYVSALVLDTDNSSQLVLHLFSASVRQYFSTRYRHSPRHVYFLVRQYCCTQYRQLITACSSFVQCLSRLVPQYSVRLVLHLFGALVRQYLSTRYRHSPRHVYLLSRLVLQYSVLTTHHGVFFICLVPQYLSTVILGTDIHHGMFISEYVSTVVLGSACSSFVWCASTLVLYYSIRTSHHVFFFICLVPQYVSTVVLATGTHHGMFSALLRQYCSTWSEQPITACCSFVQRANSFVLQYSVRTTYHGLLLLSARVRQYLSTWQGRLIL